MKFGRILLILLLVTLTGCGADWFPAFHQAPTDPDFFTFTTQTNVSQGTTVTSNSITVTGLKADSTTITVSDTTSSGSQYSINGGAFTSAQGTVKNGDTVTVQHTSSSTPGGQVVTTLTIGNVSGTFTSVASATVPLFSPQTQTATHGTTVSTSVPLTNIIVPSVFLVTVTNAQFSSDNINFVTGTQSISITTPILFLRATAPPAGQQLVVTVTIGTSSGTWTITGQ